VLALAMLVLTTLLVLGLAVGGEARRIGQAGLQTIPFMILAWLAYLGVKRDWAKVLAVVWLGLLVIGVALIAWGATFAAVLRGPITTPGVFPGFVEGGVTRVVIVTVAEIVAVGICMLGFVPAVRRAVSRWLPINPGSFVHMVALITVVVIALLFFIPLIALGAPPLLTVIAQSGTGNAEVSTNLRDLVYGLLWTIPGTIVAVGYAVQRTLRGALVRLGFVVPSARQVLIGIGMAVVLVGVVLVLGNVIDWLWTRLNWPTTDSDAFDQLIGFALNPLGAVVIGVTAGVGEELAIRGVLQPRLGILLSNLFFTSLHAFQYNWDSLIVVFLLGLAFGVLRKRTNTTTSAIAHGTYDFILVLLQVLLPQLGQ
jgi:membrane protease YdiL (CAAX protease family)